MGLELIREADMVLNACGRPVAPPGWRFVDLPRMIPLRATLVGLPDGGIQSPYTTKLENQANTLFLVRGIASDGVVSYRVRWPNGRFLSQNLGGSVAVSDLCFPTGTGGAMLALDNEQPVEKGGRIIVEIGGTNPGAIFLQFWGVLRYLVKETAADRPGSPASGPVACIIGYPAEAMPVRSGRGPVDLSTMPDPIEEARGRRRYWCGPNHNIMAPEFRIGNQCLFETPEGFEDEPFTFFSDVYTLKVREGRSFGNAVIIPGADDVVIRRWRAIITWPEASTGAPCVGMRLPNGYSITGGDLIPCGSTTAGSPALFAWVPMFPTVLVKAGERLILDVAMFDGFSGADLSASVYFEFDAVKRRRK